MAVRQRKDGRWYYRAKVRLAGNRTIEITGTPHPINSKIRAEEDEQAHIKRVLMPEYDPDRPPCPTFADWFTGAYWTEYVSGQRNKSGTADEKMRVFETTLKPAFGDKRLDEITVQSIQAFRADLLGRKLQPKTINNYVTILNNCLRYAERCQVLIQAPRVQLLKNERPEIAPFEMDTYARIVEAAKKDVEPEWYLGVLLAGEAGLRIGEIRELKWNDIDFEAGTITISRQIRHGKVDSPKGGKRRTIPMNPYLWTELANTLQGLITREKEDGKVGRPRNISPFVISNPEKFRNHLAGSQKSDGQCNKPIYRIYRNAGVKKIDGGWHLLRHTYATHAALFGVNAWSLMHWLGHGRIDETMGYVSYAADHARNIHPLVLEVGGREGNPDRRVLVMLGARHRIPATKLDRPAIQNTRFSLPVPQLPPMEWMGGSDAPIPTLPPKLQITRTK